MATAPSPQKKLGERIEIHPDGQMHGCPYPNSSPISLARFSNGEESLSIYWDTDANEMDAYPLDMPRPHPCVAATSPSNRLLPLCVSPAAWRGINAW